MACCIVGHERQNYSTEFINLLRQFTSWYIFCSSIEHYGLKIHRFLPRGAGV